MSEVGHAGYLFGTEIKLPTGSLVTRQRAIAYVGKSEYVFCACVETVGIPAWAERRKASFSQLGTTPRGDGPETLGETLKKKLGVDPADKPGKPEPEVEAIDEEEADDVRTPYLEYDDQKKRYTEWRRVIQECTIERYPDFPIACPASSVDVCTHMLRHGGSPKLWMQQWCQDKGMTQRDCTYHELAVLIEILYQAGTYDALNLGALACIEVTVRRLISIIKKTHAGGAQNPDWGNARCFSATTKPFDIVPGDLRQHVAREAKDDVEIAQLRNKARAGTSAADQHWPGAAAAAVAAGALPSDPAIAKQKLKGAGKTGKKPDAAGASTGGK